MVSTSPTLAGSIRKGTRQGFSTVFTLAKVLVPTYVLVDLLRDTALLSALARILEPLMTVFGLPGEAALVLVAGYTVNLYAAIGALAPLGLSAHQITVLGLMLGIAHGLLLETAVIRQVGTRWGLLAVLRLAVSFAAGAVVGNFGY
ncbi:MAG: nucleoside recognition protein [Deferrisomatales bacterium]